MLDAVVFTIEGRIFQPEVRAEVDDLPRPHEELGHADHGTTVGHREEKQVARVQVRMGREHEVRDLAEVRVSPAHRFSRHRVRGDLANLDLRMSEEESEDLSSGVTGTADDRDLHRFATSRT